MLSGTDRFIVEWLARAAPVPEQARCEWTDRGVALLPCGRTFGAVRLPAALVHAAADTDDTDAVAAALRALDGPVIHDGRVTTPYYALVQPHAGLVWDGAEDTPALGPESYLGVPRLDWQRPPGPHWLIPPRREGDLCRPSLVRAFIAEARQQFAPVET